MDESRQSFSIDCWHCETDELGSHYTLGLCSGDKFLRGVVLIKPRPVLQGRVLLYDNAERFRVEAVIQRPDGVSVRDAKIILEAIFRDMGEGGEYTDDWIWRPIELDDFFAQAFRQRRAAQIASALQKALNSTSVIKNPSRIKEFL